MTHPKDYRPTMADQDKRSAELLAADPPKPKMRKVVIESPFATKDPDEAVRNVRYVRAAVRDCLKRGEAPFASHALYTLPGILDDTSQEERQVGMRAGFAWGEIADAIVVYTDLGITSGMKGGMTRARNRGQAVEERSLGAAWDD
jgi:hypothetical protein